jgi:hypothetical protein
VRPIHAGQYPAHFFHRKRHRQLRLPHGFDRLKRSPLPLQSIRVEELDGTQRNLKGAGGNLPDLTEVIDRARRLATVKVPDREIVLRDAPIGESPYKLLQQVNAALAQSCQPFVAWRLEWISSEVNRLWPDGVLQIRNEHGSASVTGYAHDDAGNRPKQSLGVYLGMVGHKTVLESIRATVQSRQRKKLFLQGRPVYPLVTHYSQTWQHLPDYGAYHETLIADPALPGKWQPGEEVAYLLVFEGDMTDGEAPEEHACQKLPSWLSEALPIPVWQEWAKALWEAGIEQELISGLTTGGDNPAGFKVQLIDSVRAELLSKLLKEGKIGIAVKG